LQEKKRSFKVLVALQKRKCLELVEVFCVDLTVGMVMARGAGREQVGGRPAARTE